MSEGAAPHVLLVVAPYYTEIVEDLCRGAVTALEEQGATWERIDVAGAFEIPGAIARTVPRHACGPRRTARTRGARPCVPVSG